jgi:threonine synthase
MKHKFSHFTCSLCGTDYGPEEVTYTCPKDGGNLDVILNYDEIKKQYSADKFMDVPEAVSYTISEPTRPY